MNSPIKKILVNVDGTEEALIASRYAICLGKHLDAEIIAVYIVNTRAMNELVKSHIFLESEQQEYASEIESDAQKYLDHTSNLARKKGVTIEVIKKSGSVHQEINKLITEKKIDLLIIGELSSVQSRRDTFYNESERALRSAPCSVLVVKDEEYVWDLYEGLI